MDLRFGNQTSTGFSDGNVKARCCVLLLSYVVLGFVGSLSMFRYLLSRVAGIC